jgi:HEAT repeat protein
MLSGEVERAVVSVSRGPAMRRLVGVVGVVLALAWSAQAAPVDDLIAELKDSDPDVRRAAAKKLSESGPEARAAAPALLAALKDKDFFVRRFAARAVGKVGADPKDAVGPLVALLNDENEKKVVQEAAAQSLGKMGPGGVPALLAAVKNPNREEVVRKRAAVALGEIGPDARSAVADLTEMLAGRTRKAGKPLPPANLGEVRTEVVTALGHIAGAADDAALAVLDDIAHDRNNQDPDLRRAARAAIARIESRR